MKNKKNSKNTVRNILILYFIAFIVVLSIFISARVSIYEHEEQRAQDELSQTSQEIIEKMSIIDKLYHDRVKSSINTLIRSGQELGQPTLGDKTDFHDKSVPVLMLGDQSVIDDYSLVDMITNDMGGTATLFVKAFNGEFVRVSTNVKKDDGSRAVGTILTPGAKVETLILAGKPYYGIVDILGKPYYTAYEPINNATGDIIGIWYVGYQLEDLTSIKESIKGKKCFENDFFVILDEKERIIAHSNDQSVDEIKEKLVLAENKDGWEMNTLAFENWGYSVISCYKPSDIEKISKFESFSLLWKIGVVVLMFSLFIIFFVLSTNRTNMKILKATKTLSESTLSVSETSKQLTASSYQLSEGSTEQAASIEETSATMEETASMVGQNAQNANQANSLSQNALNAAKQGSDKVDNMIKSMGELKRSSDEIAKIINVINDIAFQTNMLALNAAVEAARAGDAGLGFAVVAEEVRNLAQKSAEAAKNTSEIIERNIVLSEQGIELSDDLSSSLKEIVEQSEKVNELMNDVNVASEEQAKGINQVTKAIGQMENVVSSNAALAEQTNASATAMQSQANELGKIVESLDNLVNGAKKNIKTKS